MESNTREIMVRSIWNLVSAFQGETFWDPGSIYFDGITWNKVVKKSELKLFEHEPQQMRSKPEQPFTRDC